MVPWHSADQRLQPKLTPIPCVSVYLQHHWGQEVWLSLIVSLLILCCPCIIWCCCLKEQYGGSTKNYSSGTQGTSCRPLAQPPQQMQQQGGYATASNCIATSCICAACVSTAAYVTTAAAIRTSSTGYASSICNLNRWP